MARNATKNLAAWKLLLSLAQGGGISEAAVAAGMDIAACSRLLRRLEEELGFKLIDHFSRPAKLTQEAVSILPAVESFAESFDRLQSVCRACRSIPFSVNLGIPVNVPRRGLFAVIKSYEKIDPAMRFVTVSDADHQDVLDGKADVAYLPYRPPAEGLLLWRVNEIGNCLLASPAYLARCGIPEHPRDLIDHAVVVRSGRHYPVTKQLECEGQCVPLMSARVAFSGDIPSGREALLAGEGIAIDFSFHAFKAEIEAGLVQVVLPGWHRPAWHMTLAASRTGMSNTRLMSFCRWFAAHEARASRIRAQEIQEYIARLKKSDRR